jgi:hypothetical protein
MCGRELEVECVYFNREFLTDSHIHSTRGI